MILAVISLAAMVAVEGPDQVTTSAGELRAQQAKADVASGKISYFPEKAKRAGVVGKATLDCLVEADGYLQDCKVASEDPVGYDFGSTALSMAPLFRYQTLPAGSAGSRVSIPLNFTFPAKN